MEIKIKILPEESEQVENLFTRYTGYCNILGYLAKDGSLESDIFDKKWEEAIILNDQLEKLKRELDQKYRPDNMNFNSYYFNFKTYEMVYEA